MRRFSVKPSFFRLRPHAGIFHKLYAYFSGFLRNRYGRAVGVRFSAVALTVELWQAGRAVPLGSVLCAMDALWQRLERRALAGNGEAV